jgi:hypothetical protein
MTKSKIPPIQELPIIPLMIAERAVWSVLEEKQFQHLSPEVCAEVVELAAPLLEQRFETHYHNHEFFRGEILNKSRDPRMICESYMTHWMQSVVSSQLWRNNIHYDQDVVKKIKELLRQPLNT